MVSRFNTFVGKSYYIYTWLVLHLWSIFITFMVSFTGGGEAVDPLPLQFLGVCPRCTFCQQTHIELFL